jgi:hypothetical protein
LIKTALVLAPYPTHRSTAQARVCRHHGHGQATAMCVSYVQLRDTPLLSPCGKQTRWRAALLWQPALRQFCLHALAGL